MNTPATPLTPKSQLLGKTLDSGWTLVEQFTPATHSTGGNFGVGYKGDRADAPRVAFLFSLYQRITSLLPAPKARSRG